MLGMARDRWQVELPTDASGAALLRKKWTMPSKKRSAIVTIADSSSDPKRPNRFEKKKNMLPSERAESRSVPPWTGRITHRSMCV